VVFVRELDSWEYNWKDNR